MQDKRNSNQSDASADVTADATTGDAPAHEGSSRINHAEQISHRGSSLRPQRRQQELWEKWDHRADLAEDAIHERHARRVWGLPGTNLAVVSWPALTRDKFFLCWHYWWQAHYLDCLVDAASRRPLKSRSRRISRTMRGIRLRNGAPLTKNRYYDDKSWLALALDRAEGLGHGHQARSLKDLQQNIIDGVDSLTGVVPWRVGEAFYNVPTNGPAAIMMARMGRVDEAEALTDWMFENLINQDGLLIDGIRMKMDGPEPSTAVYAYNQGVALGACVEIAQRRREEAGITDDPSGAGSGVRAGAQAGSDVAMSSITRVHNLVHAIAVNLATDTGVIKGSGSGDGGLFRGILVRYLALVTTDLPDDQKLSRATKRLAGKLVVSTADAVWDQRLEVNGLPVFSADWTRQAEIPRAAGSIGGASGGAVAGSEIAERDLSVQLSGWMAIEAAARVVNNERLRGA
ncbi:glycoside hydrolase family 76 [Corynebacterium parakroppenstedtii]|uniref:glycoside hydrolase family 76 protein n=1 Tax=Corynebacterium parakroppenstedtii TaxID=2828363 RepID=UPI000C7FF14E|nr:glycoside hydrolase family 76 [Corynebacterium kroppenstedtii]